MSNQASSNGREVRKPTDADRFVGKKMRQARRELSLTQETLAVLLGVTFQQIQKYEAGQSRLSAGRLREVAIALRKPIDYFYEPLPLHPTASGNAAQELKLKNLRRDGKLLIDRIKDDHSLSAVIQILTLLEKSA
ncbi:MAG: helix-turn-helix transcriptional regulator [Hyphomonas sp.]